ncbi:venom protease-like [Colias croceus]|uniref:venom protease-like n=1 Tax=Colias crocea TaxID=72248 RepID=UPI001E280FD3|nr:venom protease-like [Colias croceus]XP_045509084.1 venom protease-like [Colias croceus]XP_045509085.1 venom protease-like [Colias croceus]
MLILFIFLVFASGGLPQRIGEPCIVQPTQIVGRCVPANQCVSVREDNTRNGINPSICSYTFDGVIVCCRDGSSILQAATRQSDRRPVWSNQSANRNKRLRLSERKCEEYSRGVTQTVDFIPLVPDPDTLSISAAKCDYNGVELIVGGEAASTGEFPHMAAIGWLDEDQTSYIFLCGGSLISSRFVLTAGHCTKTTRRINNSPTIVRLGDQNLDPNVQDGAEPVEVGIKNIITHPQYRSPSKYNDIALIELKTDIDFSTNIRPACLWVKPDFNGHTKALATGWGVTDPNSRITETSKELQKVSLTLLDNRYCDQLLVDYMNRNWQGFANSQMCAGELRGGKDTCQGDSGSPLQVASRDNQCIFYVIGVTSFGRKCAQSGKPAIYTRVSSYLDWIESVVWPGE